MSPGACIIKHITAVINSVTLKASVYVKASKKCLTIAKALAYCTTELITPVKSFMIQAPEVVEVCVFTELCLWFELIGNPLGSREAEHSTHNTKDRGFESRFWHREKENGQKHIWKPCKVLSHCLVKKIITSHCQCKFSNTIVFNKTANSTILFSKMCMYKVFQK
jgi:hypothetical protein